MRRPRLTLGAQSLDAGRTAGAGRIDKT